MGNIAYCLLNHSRARHFKNEIIGINWSSMHSAYQSHTEIIGIQLIIEIIGTHGTPPLPNFKTTYPCRPQELDQFIPCSRAKHLNSTTAPIIKCLYKSCKSRSRIPSNIRIPRWLGKLSSSIWIPSWLGMFPSPVSQTPWSTWIPSSICYQWWLGKSCRSRSSRGQIILCLLFHTNSIPWGFRSLEVRICIIDRLNN